MAANGAGPIPASSTTRKPDNGPGTLTPPSPGLHGPFQPLPSKQRRTAHTGRVPFTAAHPAAILPLLRRGRWVSAGLVTGSIAPDLPTYLPLGLTHEQTHPLTAILWPDGLLAIGSGGNFALAAARALVRHSPGMTAREIATSAMKIASEICIYTNANFTVEEL